MRTRTVCSNPAPPRANPPGVVTAISQDPTSVERTAALLA